MHDAIGTLDAEQLSSPKLGFVPVVQIVVGLCSTFAIVGTGLGWDVALPQAGKPANPYLLLTLFGVVAYQTIATRVGCYDIWALARVPRRPFVAPCCWLAAFSLCLTILFLFKASSNISRAWMTLWGLTAGVGIAAIQLALARYAQVWRSTGRFNRRAVVIGGGDYGARFIDTAKISTEDSFSIIGYFDDRTLRAPRVLGGVPYLGTTVDLIQFSETHQLDEIIIALPWSADARILAILSKIRHLTVDIRLAPEKIAFTLPTVVNSRVLGLPVLGLLENPLSGWKLVVKASEDRMLAAVLLVAFLPAMLVIAALIKIDSPGPVLFRQRRTGFNNIPFHVLKFRTMQQVPAQDSSSLRQAELADPRITRIGRLLRRSSLDEIPQLLNVLKGNMSLVGPRPHPLWQNAADLSWKELGDTPLNAVVAEYMARHRVKPGITGWAQVRGYRGQTETVAMMQRRIEHDLYYIERWSLWFDLKILFLTIFAVLRCENAR